ncbi:amidohydrolase [Arthrobacter crystallopoietes]|uniref:amidohydrolase n=1 Tax=Crystallibacter crystallopoietes TaxID=37928 RepID=UPI001111059F|nr:amidohydrolase [Arthrobacter crystallopoietes]QTG81279.1 amidohydrolase [Arthrobacter crystallopoietes]
MEQRAAAADMVVINATVPGRALPNGSSDAANVAVSGGRIHAIGGQDVLGMIGPRTRIIDADGGALLPGINDAHLHFIASSMVRFGYVRVGSDAAARWEDVCRIIEQARPEADGWVRAHGWDELVLGPGGPELILDCKPGTPVVVFDQTGHQLLANRVALEIAGITVSTPAPTGGVIERDADGSPTGRLIDAAMELMTRALPALPVPVMRDAALRFQQVLHAQGITSLTEPGLGPGAGGLLDGSCTTAALDLLGNLALSGELTLRINTLLLFAGTGGISAGLVRDGLASGLHRAYTERGIDSSQLRIAGVKVFADGTPRSGTAWMTEPYGHACTHGSMVIAGNTDAERSAELDEIVRLIHSEGLQAGIHATGDAATEAAMNAVIRAQAIQPGDNRHYVIHGSFPSNQSLTGLAEHGIGYSTNPMIRSGGGSLLEGILGPERFRRHQPLRSAARQGVRFNIASDSPVTTTDWRRTILAAVTRSTVDHPEPVDDGEGLGLVQALAAMTSQPAWQDHAEQFKGTLRPGLTADLCILDAPWPADSEPDALLERHVAWTISGGQIVHEPSMAPAAGLTL